MRNASKNRIKTIEIINPTIRVTGNDLPFSSIKKSSQILAVSWLPLASLLSSFRRSARAVRMLAAAVGWRRWARKGGSGVPRSVLALPRRVAHLCPLPSSCQRRAGRGSFYSSFSFSSRAFSSCCYSLVWLLCSCVLCLIAGGFFCEGGVAGDLYFFIQYICNGTFFMWVYILFIG